MRCTQQIAWNVLTSPPAATKSSFREVRRNTKLANVFSSDNDVGCCRCVRYDVRYLVRTFKRLSALTTRRYVRTVQYQQVPGTLARHCTCTVPNSTSTYGTCSFRYSSNTVVDCPKSQAPASATISTIHLHPS